MIKYFCDMCYREMEEYNGEGVIEIYLTTNNYISKQPDKRFMVCDECITFISSVISTRDKSDDLRNYLKGGVNND